MPKPFLCISVEGHKMIDKILELIAPFLTPFIMQVVVSSLVVGFVVGKVREALSSFFPTIEQNTFYRTVVLQFLPMILGGLGTAFLFGATGFWGYGVVGGAISAGVYSYVKALSKRYLEGENPTPPSLNVIGKIFGVKLD
jgi:ABC-type uncharacterized transport system permease subunit